MTCETKTKLLEQLEEKFQALSQNTNVHLEGLLYAKPITYWDYIQTDALLNLQIQRTTLPDEMVFIMYHQVNELLFKMVLWEIDQLSEMSVPDVIVFTEKLGRISRYFDMLSSSFEIMQHGMQPGQYLKFRNTLTPASGFQSVQYRLIEFASTDIIHLVDHRYRQIMPVGFEQILENLYWQAAGKDRGTGKKTTLLTLFEQKYKPLLLSKMNYYQDRNLWSVFCRLPKKAQQDQQLIEAMRHYDYTVNVKWVLAHYRAAEHYLDAAGKTKEATGGSDWEKYMHPHYQRRIFFPGLWTEQELKDWGKETNHQHGP